MKNGEKQARKGKAAARAKPQARSYCTLREPPERQFSARVSLNQIKSIVELSSKWVNGSRLKYAFFENTPKFKALAGTEAQKKVFRDAVKALKLIGIGLDFVEVANREESDFRVAFKSGDGHWSYMGRAVRNYGPDEPTMNLDVSAGNFDVDTAIHELGHTIGLPHEHQNPNAGIVWDEPAVYAALAAPPNNWSKEVTFHNIIRKLPTSSVHGSKWDPDSIMHYPFEPGLIKSPAKYANGLTPAGGLSAIDRQWITKFYPPLVGEESVLAEMESLKLKLKPSQQANLTLRPSSTRLYEIRTFGQSDVVAVLFERTADGDRQIAADDDSGEDRNAYLKQRLDAGKTYVLRIRLYHEQSSGQTAVMWW